MPDQHELSDKQLLAILALVPEATAIYSGDDIIIRAANDTMLAFWAKDRSVIGLPLYEGVPELQGQPFLDMLQAVWRTGITDAGTIEAVTGDGDQLRKAYYSYTYQAIKDTNGQTYAILHTAKDVTELEIKRQKEATGNERVRFLLDAMPQQVWTTRPDGSIDYVNAVMCSNFGAKSQEIIGQGWQNYIHPEDLPACLNSWNSALESGQPYQIEYRLRFIDGIYRWHLSRAVPLVEDGEIQLWIGTNTEIEAQKDKEQKKDEFLSIASHELKTPLTTIKAFFQLSKKEIEANEKLNFFVGKAERQLDRLGRLIEDLLDVSKINAGKMIYNLADFDFRKALNEVIESFEETSAKHRIELQGDDAIIFHGDQHRIEQVVSNLLSNAIKYSPDADRVLVSYELSGQNIILSVQDFGIGIAPEHMEGLFDRFYRIDNTASRFQGLGLGLFIAAEIVKRHGGSFWIESDPAIGSTFSLLLPLAGRMVFEELETDHATFYRGSFITIVYNPQKQMLDVDWLGYQNYDSVVKGCLIMLDLLIKNNCTMVLNDNTHVEGNWSEAADWGASVWFPQMAEGGLKRFAWIYSPSTFSRISSNKSLPPEFSQATVSFFNNKQQAEDWLLGTDE